MSTPYNCECNLNLRVLRFSTWQERTALDKGIKCVQAQRTLTSHPPPPHPTQKQTPPHISCVASRCVQVQETSCCVESRCVQVQRTLTSHPPHPTPPHPTPPRNKHPTPPHQLRSIEMCSSARNIMLRSIEMCSSARNIMLRRIEMCASATNVNIPPTPTPPPPPHPTQKQTPHPPHQLRSIEMCSSARNIMLRSIEMCSSARNIMLRHVQRMYESKNGRPPAAVEWGYTQKQLQGVLIFPRKIQETQSRAKLYNFEEFVIFFARKDGDKKELV